jgi:RHS repeat-associated protein
MNAAINGAHFASYGGNCNVAALGDATSTNILAQYEDGPFGEVLRATGPMARVNPFRWSTQYQDDETDLLYYGHRYYNASTGRWLGREPLADEAFFENYSADKNEVVQIGLRKESLKPSYVFALNQPVSAIDVLGLDRWEVNWIHSWVVVELWDEECCKVVGYERIEFRPRGGWGLLISAGTAGFVGPGEVKLDSGNKPSGWAPTHIPSSCAADKFLLAWAQAMAADPPLYSFWAFNCRTFAAITQMVGIEETAQ